MNILILGGSEFMGKTLIDKLIEEKHNIYMINRGKWYWNEYMKDKKEINYYYGDRDNY